MTQYILEIKEVGTNNLTPEKFKIIFVELIITLIYISNFEIRKNFSNFSNIPGMNWSCYVTINKFSQLMKLSFDQLWEANSGVNATVPTLCTD